MSQAMSRAMSQAISQAISQEMNRARSQGMSTSHEMEDEAPPRDCRLRSRADGYGGAVTCQDTQQQSESQANHELPAPPRISSS